MFFNCMGFFLAFWFVEPVWLCELLLRVVFVLILCYQILR